MRPVSIEVHGVTVFEHVGDPVVVEVEGAAQDMQPLFPTMSGKGRVGSWLGDHDSQGLELPGAGIPAGWCQIQAVDQLARGIGSVHAEQGVVAVLAEQGAHPHPERLRQAQQGGDCRLAIAGLDARQVCFGHPDQSGQIVEGQAPPIALSSEPGPERQQHERRRHCTDRTAGLSGRQRCCR